MHRSTTDSRRSDRSHGYTGFFRFVRSASAHAAGEYAVLLGCVAGCVLVASSLVGVRVRDTLDGLAATSMSQADPQAITQAEEMQAAKAVDARPDKIGQLHRFRLLAAEMIALAALAGVWYLMHAARKRKELLGDDDEVPRTITRAIDPNRLFRKRQDIYRRLAFDMQAILSDPMSVEHVMSKNPTTVLPSTPVEEVVRRIEKDKFRHLLVCDRKRNLVGIISDRDLTRQNAATAAEMMTPDPITVRSNAPISVAITLMLNKHISCLPVVDDEGELCAVLTTTDFAMALQCVTQILHTLSAELSAPDDESGRFFEANDDDAPTAQDGGEAADHASQHVAVATELAPK